MITYQQSHLKFSEGYQTSSNTFSTSALTKNAQSSYIARIEEKGEKFTVSFITPGKTISFDIEAILDLIVIYYGRDNVKIRAAIFSVKRSNA